MQEAIPQSAHDCLAAVRLAEAAATRGGHNVGDYTLVRAEYLVAGTATSHGDPRWRIAFKRRDLLPATGGRVGAGGEVFVEVDLDGGQATVTGLGE